MCSLTVQLLLRCYDNNETLLLRYKHDNGNRLGARPQILVRPSQRSDQQRHCYTFPNTETTPAALILWDNSNPDQYWIVENRNSASSPRDFDRNLPSSGLAIWWVDHPTNSLTLIDASRLSLLATRYQL